MRGGEGHLNIWGRVRTSPVAIINVAFFVRELLVEPYINSDFHKALT